MLQTFENIEKDDLVKLNIREKPLYVESVNPDAETIKVFLTGIGTGRYQLLFNRNDESCRFYRKKSEDGKSWTSPRFVDEVTIERKDASKAELYI